jgi:hypothetical protein
MGKGMEDDRRVVKSLFEYQRVGVNDFAVEFILKQIRD